MAKLLLLSVVFGMVAVPLWAARDPSPRRALRRTIFFTSAAIVAYALALRFLLPRLS